MSMDFVVDVFALIGLATCLYLAARGLFAFLGWVERSEIERQRAEESGAVARPAGSHRSAAAAGEIPAEVVAVITAAVAAVGGHHVVFINDVVGGQSWSLEGRRLHQTSHRTR